MSGFSADWLALREPADSRARDACAGLLAGLTPPTNAPLEILDLGAGTGANLRYLQPRLPGPQRWTLADRDRGLLEVALARATAAGTSTATGAGAGPSPGDSGTRPRLEILDLATGLASLPLPPAGLVTASALLDLVSAPWLAVLAARCREARVQVLFALTYDGRVTCRPSEPDDATIVALVNRHQRTDKGFGPALGPAAAGAATARFAQAGFRLRRAPSDWRIGAAEPALQAALLTGWAQAAREMAPGACREIDGWLARRFRHLEAGRSRLTVGHEDLVGTLPEISAR